MAGSPLTDGRCWIAIGGAILRLACLLAFGIGAPAAAQTIENIAYARWIEEGAVQETASNPVTVTAQPRGAAITTWRVAPGAPLKLTYMPTICGKVAGTTPSDPANARTASVAPSEGYRVGEAILFEVTAPFANRDPAVIDTIALVVTAPRGDSQDLIVPESGPDTGRFIGTLLTAHASQGIVPDDCRLSVESGDVVALAPPGAATLGMTLRKEVTVLADPFGIVFDSETGTPVSGARVTLRDAATGQPASVFAEDGVTPWPSSLVSGADITDGAGNTYPMEPGRYWFPLTFFGRYRLEIEPPPPYTAPSAASRAQLEQLTRPDGRAFVIADASFGAEFALSSPVPVEIDVPLDAPGGAINVAQTVSRPVAQPGDALFYTILAASPDAARARRDVRITVALPRGLRLRPDTIRIDGVAAPEAVTLAPDGQSLVVTRAVLPAGRELRITYAASVRADASPGQLESTVEVVDGLGRRARTGTVVRIERDNLSGRMTIIGRVVRGDCRAPGTGLAGARVMMEDGSFAVTDAEGRYRFEGVVPGTHVVQLAKATVLEGAALAACDNSTRSAGDSWSRFVTGQGGALARADFHVLTGAEAGAGPYIAPGNLLKVAEADLRPSPPTPLSPPPSPIAATAPKPAEAPEADWLAQGDGPDGWLAPAEDHNPRAPAVKVAFRHRPGHTVRLLVDGTPADLAAFDGTMKSPGGRFAVSLWRGIPLRDERTQLTVEVLEADGKVKERFERTVFFTSQPARATLVPEQSLLIADGVTRPVVTVRFTDRNGRPVREGVAGDFVLGAPFESAAQIDLQQVRQLTGIGAATARWIIEGDDGLARIELAPTMVSGRLRIEFNFSQDNIRRRQEVEAWITPGDIPWTLVGLGEATVGARSIADNMERASDFDSDLGRDARIALYAKGRVLGKYLLTLAYDSAKQRADQPLLGAIDPTAYYTVFGDTSQRRFDAASREKLYVRIETAAFQAIYGDFQTGFDDTVLGRYQRTATGVRAEGQLGSIRAEGFAARIGSRFQRDEFQGNGLAGPYPLSRRDIAINSERVTIEVRDRFRPGAIVSARSLARFVDYTIDVLSGTITFSQAVLSRDADLNPQIVVIEYETAEATGGPVNAGVRADWTSGDGAVRVGASAISDAEAGAGRTTIGAADVRVQVSPATEVRGEVAVSALAGGSTAAAWIAEVQHQTGALDVIAYAREIGTGFGADQQRLAEAGRRQIGLDARYQWAEQWSATASLISDASLTDARQRRGGRGEIAYRSPGTDARLGLARFVDRLGDGSSAVSTLLETAGAQRFFDNRLELNAASSFALGASGSLDLPPRRRFGLRYEVAQDVRLTGAYEIAEGAAIDARTLRGGIEVTPWQGGQIVSGLGRVSGAETGDQLLANVGLAQTVEVTPTLTLGATVDGNRLLSAAPSSDQVVNPGQPIANGGPLGVDRTLFEDFTAVTLTGTWRKDRWSANGRGEYRNGRFADRWGATFGVIRQIGEGRAVGGNLLWTRSRAPGGASSAIIDAGITLAHRPDGSDFALLGRIEYRSDAVTGAVAGELGPAGRTALTVTGDALSQRLVGSISANWSPRVRDGAGQLSELGLFLGSRYSFDRLDLIDLSGVTALAGLDVRVGLSEWLDFGGSATLRANVTDGSFSYALGPQASVVMAEGTLLSLGYNIAGFRDPDFGFDRALDEGIFAAIRFKFDADLLGGQAGRSSQSSAGRAP